MIGDIAHPLPDVEFLYLLERGLVAVRGALVHDQEFDVFFAEFHKRNL